MFPFLNLKRRRRGQYERGHRYADVPPSYHGAGLTEDSSAGYPATLRENPRGVPPGPTTILKQTQSGRVFTDSPPGGSIQTGPSNGLSAFELPVVGIKQFNLVLTPTYTSGGAVTGSLQATTFFTFIFVLNPEGTPISIIPPTVLHALYVRYGQTTVDFTDTSTALVINQTAKALPVITVPMPWFNLPQPAGPKGYQVQFQYAGLASLGSWGANNQPTITAATGLTAATINVVGYVMPGYGGRAERRIYVGGLSGLTAGLVSNDEGPLVTVKNKSIEDMFIFKFAADADLDHFTYLAQGYAPDAYVDQPTLAARWTDAIQATRPVGAWWWLPTSQIMFGPNVQWSIYLATGATTTSFQYCAVRWAAPGSP